MIYKLTFKPGAEDIVFRLLQETPAVVVSVKDVISVIQINFKMKDFVVLEENHREMEREEFIRTSKDYRVKKKTNIIKNIKACKL